MLFNVSANLCSNMRWPRLVCPVNLYSNPCALHLIDPRQSLAMYLCKPQYSYAVEHGHLAGEPLDDCTMGRTRQQAKPNIKIGTLCNGRASALNTLCQGGRINSACMVLAQRLRVRAQLFMTPSIQSAVLGMVCF